MNLKEALSQVNRWRKEIFPAKFIRRTKYETLEQKYLTLVNAIANFRNPLREPAEMVEITSFQQKQQELCLFVSYSATTSVKPHVEKHIKALLAEKIAVLLIINTDKPLTKGIEQAEWMNQLSGLYIRENIGFDFSAWSQVFKKIAPEMNCERLFLINDSIIGPLKPELFAQLINKIRSSTASLIGLTENTQPRYHLQSFFLAVNKDLLSSQFFGPFFSDLWSLPSKEMVIDMYETHLTKCIQAQGFKTEAIFPSDIDSTGKTDNVLHQVSRLFAAGFPYIKTSISKSPEAQILLKEYTID